MKIDWTSLIDPAPFQLNKSEIASPWFVVCENIAGVTHLRITAKGEWSLPSICLGSFNQDGGALPGVPVTLPELAHAPFAALVGKIGGASAGTMPPAAPGPGVTSPSPPPSPPPWPPQFDQPFLIGALCILALPPDALGPLYLGFNCLIRPIEMVSLEVTVEGAIPFVTK